MIDGDVSAPTGRTTSTERSGRPARRSTARPRGPLATRADELVGFIKDVTAKPKPAAVHHLRSTIRRVETLLATLAAEPSKAERKLQKQLDHVRKRAGKVRDDDVHLKLLAGLARRSSAGGHDEIRDALAKLRAKHEKKLLRTLGDERDRGLVKRLRRVVGDALEASSRRPVDVDGVLTEVVDRFHSELQTATPLGAENLHALRIHTKRLRYLAESVSTPAAERAVAQLKRAQDAIGAWHDWLTLGVRIAEAAGDEHPEALAAVQTRADAQLSKAIAVTGQVGRRLAALRPGGRRKGVRPVTPASPVSRSAGASA